MPVLAPRIRHVNARPAWTDDVPVFNPLNFGARGNGTFHDWPALQRMFAAAQEEGGAVIVFPPGKTFCVEATAGNTGWTPADWLSNVYVYGYGATLKWTGTADGTDDTSILRLLGNNCGVEGLTLQWETEPDVDEDPGPNGTDGSSSLVMGGDGPGVSSGGADHEYASNIFVRNCRFLGSYWAAMQVFYGENFYIERNYTRNTLATAIYPSNPRGGVHIVGNIIEDTRDDGIHAEAGAANGTVIDGIVIQKNIIRRSSAAGITVSGAKGGIVTHNVITDTRAAGINVLSGGDWLATSALNTSDNTITNAGRHFGVGKHHGSAGSQGHGISSSATTDAITNWTIDNNTLITPFAVGINAKSVTAPKIRGNEVNGTETALWMTTAVTDPIVEGNRFYNSSGNAVLAASGVLTGGLFRNNIIEEWGAAFFAFNIQNSSGFHIDGNQLVDASVGAAAKNNFTGSTGYSFRSPNQAYSKAYTAVNLAIPHSTPTAVSFDTNAADFGGVHSTSSNPTRFTVPTDCEGIWRIHAALAWAVDAGTGTGGRGVRIRKNGTTVLALEQDDADALQVYVRVTAVDPAAVAGDYYEVLAQQSSGSDLNVLSGLENSWAYAEKQQ